MPKVHVILVTGATGYVGGRLVPRLLEAGFQVRCLVRDKTRLQGRWWLNKVELVTGDFLQPSTLQSAMQGVRVLYYLVHSMGGGTGFVERDLVAARNAAEAAKAAGVLRIIYLGGLGDAHAPLSPHLRSRQETGDVLREAGVPVTEFRAAVIVGSGSLSFEMIRYLTERLPAMICPRWVFTRTQPIAIRNVLDYLVAALEQPASMDRVVEIGGRDVLTYAEMMNRFAAVRGLKRWLIPVPFLTPRISSYWVHIITPIPASIARPLIKGLGNEVIVLDHSARTLFPSVKPIDYETAVRWALERIDTREVETVWSDALTSSQGDQVPVALVLREGMILERRQRTVHASAQAVFQAFSGLGGKRGWLYWDWAWKVRGMMDRIIGGVGMRRGRRHPEELRPGDALDFWRVEAVEPGQLVRLRAEMRVPGRAWLQFQAISTTEKETLIQQTAFFEPRGLLGLVYWYVLYPIHALIFRGMLRRISDRSELLSLNHSEGHFLSDGHFL